MKLRKRVVNRTRLLMVLCVMAQILLWILAFMFMSGEELELIKGMLLIFGVLTIILAIPSCFTNLFVKDFDAFYKTLSETEKKLFDEAIESASSDQKVIMTSKLLVRDNFITINTFRYEDIASVKKMHNTKQGDFLMLYDKTKVIGSLPGTSQCPVEQILQELLRHNDKIIYHSN